MSSETEQKLQRLADAVRIPRLAKINVTKPESIPGEVFHGWCQKLVSQAILDDIDTNEENLIIRNIIPHVDLLDGNGSCIDSDDWKQPVTGLWPDLQHPSSDCLNVYSTGKNCDYERKVYLFYGIRNMNTVSYTNRIVFMTGWVRTRDMVDVSDLTNTTYNNGLIAFQFPILYKRSENSTIRFYLKEHVSTCHDNFKLLGMVCESAGHSICG